jgi:hypothetical protein
LGGGNHLHPIASISVTKKPCSQGGGRTRSPPHPHTRPSASPHFYLHKIQVLTLPTIGTGAAKCSASTRGNRLPSFGSTLTHVFPRAREARPGGRVKTSGRSRPRPPVIPFTEFFLLLPDNQITGNHQAHHGTEARPGAHQKSGACHAGNHWHPTCAPPRIETIFPYRLRGRQSNQV